MHDAYRIILADDDEGLALLLTRLILRHYPTAVVQACGNGRDALAGYDAVAADLLFVNHSMPDMDGPTLIRTLRARGDSVPVIGMSGDPSLHDEYMIAGPWRLSEVRNCSSTCQSSFGVFSRRWWSCRKKPPSTCGVRSEARSPLVMRRGQ